MKNFKLMFMAAACFSVGLMAEDSIVDDSKKGSTTKIEEVKKAKDLEDVAKIEEAKKAKDLEDAAKIEEAKKAKDLEDVAKVEEAKKAKDLEDAAKVEEAKKAKDLEDAAKVEAAKKAKALEDAKNKVWTKEEIKAETTRLAEVVTTLKGLVPALKTAYDKAVESKVEADITAAKQALTTAEADVVAAQKAHDDFVNEHMSNLAKFCSYALAPVVFVGSYLAPADEYVVEKAQPVTDFVKDAYSKTYEFVTNRPVTMVVIAGASYGTYYAYTQCCKVEEKKAKN